MKTALPARRSLSALALLLTIAGFSARSQAPSEAIGPDRVRLNQIGYYPNAEKVAVLVGDAQGAFQLMTPDLKKIVFTGTLSAARTNAISGKITHLADFSQFSKTGSYVVVIPGMGHSYPFDIRPDVHRAAAIASVKGFYYQRASTDLPAKYAGTWARPAGHPDNRVLVHPSAVSPGRPAGTVISSPRGWYDAGDYNKYIVNSGITMGTLLSLCEDFPAFVKTINTNIPESGNKIPDILDEALWNLRWMLTMQDPGDGGVYHKLTNASFDGMVLPDKATKDRYVVQKGITATLDFAAVMAQAGRVLKPYSSELPGLADSCRSAAVRAWGWAKANPNVVYDQRAMNTSFDPDVSTGGYEDRNSADEWIWAAAELYVTTKDDAYYTAVNLFPDERMPLPNWGQVRTLGYYTLARAGSGLTAAGKKDLPMLKKRLTAMADSLIDGTDRQAFGTVMGKSARDYGWGSSSEAANQGIALIQAYRLTDSPNRSQYLRDALGNLDYLLGRNAVGYSFLTGFGEKSTLHPHHRPSVGDGIETPVPGLLSGGTNARAAQQDKCAGYTTTVADEVYLDESCSYASNEIAINWNAPMVYLTMALEALQSEQKISVDTNSKSPNPANNPIPCSPCVIFSLFNRLFTIGLPPVCPANRGQVPVRHGQGRHRQLGISVYAGSQQRYLDHHSRSVELGITGLWYVPLRQQQGRLAGSRAVPALVYPARQLAAKARFHRLRRGHDRHRSKNQRATGRAGAPGWILPVSLRHYAVGQNRAVEPAGGASQ